jgi:pimeloyl-ACP methyl ester carboxylesterase
MKIIHANRFGEGKDLVVIHGFLGMGDNWKSLGKKWAQKRYRVHLLDMRNHGRSFHDDTFNYQVMTQDVKNYLNEQKIENCILIGHSMGGKVAMQLATSKSELVTKLIVVDIAPRYYPKHHVNILNALSLLDDHKLTSRKEADKLLSNKIDEVGIRQFLLKNLYRTDENELKLRLNLKAVQENLEEIGQGLADELIYNGPVLFIKGGTSDYIKASDEKKIFHHFPQARVQIVENAGHWVHAEQPDTFFEEVDKYIE